jgi:putative copper resistance protein D
VTGPQIVLVVARLAHYAALTFAFGAALFPLYAYGPDVGLRERAGRRLGWLTPSAAIVALLSGLAWLAASAATMADDPAAAFDPATLGAIVTDMDFGRIWAARMVVALALVLVSLRPSMPAGAPRPIAAALAGLLLASIAATGHGVSGAAAIAPWHAVSDALHLLAAGAWIGALAPLAVLAGAGDASGDALGRARLLARFSRVGYLAVATLIATGLVNAWLLVGSVEALVATPYGRVLALKLVLFVAMLGFAAANRFHLTPAIAAPAPGDDPARLLRRLRRHVLAEQGLALGVLTLVALLGTLAPAVVD